MESKTEKLLPKREAPRSENVDPNTILSKQEAIWPTRTCPATDRELPTRAKQRTDTDDPQKE